MSPHPAARGAPHVVGSPVTKCASAVPMNSTPRASPARNHKFRRGKLNNRIPPPAGALRAEPTSPRGGEVKIIIDAKGVWKRYDAGKHKIEALRGLDLVVRRGEVVAIMGPSGCGKTTLLNCLSGLDVIDEGTIKIAGRDLKDLTD